MNLRGHFKKWLKIWILKHAHELIAYQKDISLPVHWSSDWSIMARMTSHWLTNCRQPIGTVSCILIFPSSPRLNVTTGVRILKRMQSQAQMYNFIHFSVYFLNIYKLGFKGNLLFCWPLFRETFPDSAWIQWLTRRYSTYVLRMISEIYRQHWNMFVPNIIWRLGRRSAIHN